MQVSTKFTIAVHILVATKFFGEVRRMKITSKFLAGSIGSNPVIVRNIMLQLQDAGIINVKRGPGGIKITRPLRDISFLDVYKAVETRSEDNMFRFHEHPNPQCPVGGNIHRALDGMLEEINNRFENDLAQHSVQTVYDNVEEAQETA